jgi:very-short-patch-repair endonuclease
MQLHFNPLTTRAQIMRKSMTTAERRLWFDCLKKLPYSFRRQRPIGRFIADFYSPTLKLVIEVDGLTHDSKEAIAYDSERTIFLSGKGLTVLRFTNDDVMNSLESVYLAINNWITSTQVPPERGDVTQ